MLHRTCFESIHALCSEDIVSTNRQQYRQKWHYNSTSSADVSEEQTKDIACVLDNI